MSKQNITIPPPLSAQDRSSFAYKTIKDRLPVIIVKTIDFFHRQRKELYKFGGTISSPNEAQLAELELDAKATISQLTQIRKDLETNKAALLLERINNLGSDLEFFNDDVELWNKALNQHKLNDGSLPRWFDSPWLLVECYLYRQIKQIMLKSNHLKMFDPFVEQKQAACRSAILQMTAVANHLIAVEKTIKEATNHSHPSERSQFSLFIQLALWANKSDLSISGMSADRIQLQKATVDLRESLESLEENILCDNMSEVWFKAQSIKSQVKERSQGNKPIFIDLVADNSGYELFVDFCLIHFLTLMLCPQLDTSKEVFKVRIHVKRMPWFVSDTLRQDIDWLLNFLSNQDASLQALSKKWKVFIESKSWEIYDHKFWTLPDDYNEMESVSEDLYKLLSGSSLIIFKGDLNYRKLVGDRKWHLLTPFRVALRNFCPAPLVALRTAKADVVVGIEDVNLFAKINNNELPRDWMLSGEYGQIQFVDPL